MAGKGSHDTRLPNFQKRREAWDRIFGPKEASYPPDMSKCCGAPVQVYSSGEGTNSYECARCKKPV